MSKIIPAFLVIDEFSNEVLSIHLGYSEIKPFVDGIGIGIKETWTKDGRYQSRRYYHLMENANEKTKALLFDGDNGHEYVDYFLCERAAVYDNGKNYFINMNNEIISELYDEVKRYYKNYAIVRRGNSWGVIDINGVEVLKTNYDFIDWNNEILEVYKGDKTFYITLRDLSISIISNISNWED